MKRPSRLRWMFTRCGICHKRIWFAPFVLVLINPRKSWDVFAVHDFDCGPVQLFKSGGAT